MKLNYYILDVFTRDRLAGNPLAVVLKADGLSEARMQAIAAEFNLSETVFICSPNGERHTAALKIFTPWAQLAFAGHPTVGAAVLLGLQNRVSALRLELGVGLVTAVMERIDKRTGEAKFGLPRLPETIGNAPDAATIAQTLGISADDVGCGPFAPALMSAGNPFYLIPVRDARVLEALKLERRGWAEAYPEGSHSVYVFTATPDERRNDYAARKFGFALGIGEDPATGSAAAALAGLLAERAGLGNGQHTIRLRQGHEMGRPSLIELQLKIADGALTHAGIGGSAVVLAEGVLDLGE